MTKNILIIEDEDFFRELLRKKLSSNDFNVSEAVDGESGLEKIKATQPDLVLLDLLLPDISGFDVLEKIQSDPKTSMIPVIILSNLGERKDIEKGLKLGAVNHLIKAQSSINEIIDKINNVLK